MKVRFVEDQRIVCKVLLTHELQTRRWEVARSDYSSVLPEMYNRCGVQASVRTSFGSGQWLNPCEMLAQVGVGTRGRFGLRRRS